MKIAILALLALPSLHANVLTYNIVKNFTGQLTGDHVDAVGVLDVPLFDPALGELDSISYQFGVGAGVHWTVNWRTVNTSLTDTNLSGGYTFLGATHSSSSTNASTGGPVCGPDALDQIHFGTCPTIGAIPVIGSTTAATITDVMTYLGPGTISLPFSARADASIGYSFAEDGHLYFGKNNAVISIGGLNSVGIQPFLTWTYNYTAASVDTPTVTPEPRTSACLVALMGLLLIGRKRFKGTYFCSETTPN